MDNCSNIITPVAIGCDYNERDPETVDILLIKGSDGVVSFYELPKKWADDWKAYVEDWKRTHGPEALFTGSDYFIFVMKQKAKE